MRLNSAYNLESKESFEIEMSIGDKSHLNHERYAGGELVVSVVVDLFQMFGKQCSETGFQDLKHESIKSVAYECWLYLIDQDGGEIKCIESYELNDAEKQGLADKINHELWGRGYECCVKVGDL